MGERKSKSSCKTSTHSRSNMASTVTQQGIFVSSNAKIVRCPDGILTRLRRLHEAEIITLFTPFVPHPPATKLAKDSDPFEPLGRALPRQVRHVPYRLDKGMMDLHADFLPASGAVVIVVCVTENVLRSNAKAFEQQVDFAKNIWRRLHETSAIAGIPAILLLVSSDAAGQAYADAMQEFPALVMVNNYTTSALADAVRVLFGL